jgi:biopolymer transport protein ExbB
MWTLRRNVVMPKDLLARVVQEYRQNGVSPETINRLSADSPLGQIFAAAHAQRRRGTRGAKRKAIEEAAAPVADRPRALP